MRRRSGEIPRMTAAETQPQGIFSRQCRTLRGSLTYCSQNHEIFRSPGHPIPPCAFVSVAKLLAVLLFQFPDYRIAQLLNLLALPAMHSLLSHSERSRSAHDGEVEECMHLAFGRIKEGRRKREQRACSGDVFYLYVHPFFFEVFGDEAAMAVMRLFLAAE
jgi:hypothetical protein